ncbi:hypothetical protein [Mucilaginibacter gracilis]|nr:hypothetical protein [Mucilaginibacter gracilis]
MTKPKANAPVAASGDTPPAIRRVTCHRPPLLAQQDGDSLRS